VGQPGGDGGQHAVLGRADSDVLVAAQLAAAGVALGQPALQAADVHQGHGAAAAARRHERLAPAGAVVALAADAAEERPALRRRARRPPQAPLDGQGPAEGISDAQLCVA